VSRHRSILFVGGAIMKKLLLFAALALTGLSFSFAEAFSGLVFESELGAEAMAAIDGQMFTIVVPFNGRGNATVTNTERYGSKTFTVPVTTVAKAANPKNQPTDSSGKIYTPVPLPVGTHKLGSTQVMSNSVFGTGIKIDTTVATPYKDGSGSFNASDFYVHPTPYGNTWGCVGVQASAQSSASANMAKVIDAYNNSSGSKILIVR
jgi:hypothetical protein